MTHLIRFLYNLTPQAQGSVMTIGNFDGVHLGHQKLVSMVVKKAKALGVPSLIMTFEPHPFEFFTQENLTIPRLTRLREKFCALADCGVDYVLILPFNQKVAEISASDFVKEILFHQLHPRHIIVGDDFHFGYKRQGDFELLKRMGSELNFSVEATPTIDIDGERVSSTRVRNALGKGDLDLVKKLLGRPFSLMGRIRLGHQRGRELGFPTANIYLHRRLTPIRGVYTVLMHGVDDEPHPGVANVGERPTVDGTRTLLEVHLLDFNHEIYGRYATVEFCKKLRDEIRFPNLAMLKEQITKDVVAAKNYFQNLVRHE